ncbi:Uncharacterised protein [Mycobacteroides abscessus]|nr:Uncharacterised protein [Mycobacteroides abscessus]
MALGSLLPCSASARAPNTGPAETESSSGLPIRRPGCFNTLSHESKVGV